MTTRHVVVMPYDERWAQDFEAIASEIRDSLGELALAIEHVGSTSVPGLSAKPIIDDAVPPTKRMQKLERKSEKAHERLDAAREKLLFHQLVERLKPFLGNLDHPVCHCCS